MISIPYILLHQAQSEIISQNQLEDFLFIYLFIFYDDFHMIHDCLFTLQNPIIAGEKKIFFSRGQGILWLGRGVYSPARPNLNCDIAYFLLTSLH